MTRDDAEDYLRTYQITAKRWALMLSGMADGDVEATQRWLEEGARKLDEIGTEFPEWARKTNTLRGLGGRKFNYSVS